MYNQDSVLENETHKLGFWDTKGPHNLSQTARPTDSQKKKKKKENLSNRGLSNSGWAQGKTERKRNDRLVPEPC